ncbi:SH3 domain-containing protein [Tuwongella immobilis]|uniref:SH3b domain-containing protein n=1 Tax=Tuwongella immobilis TaxID=692036 RepID=A0A6C2YKP8_9BACT|nr:SH3 domain-containing protein [Tuwongella immobilis]VIP01881.1 unnamed protein product [Tuwongella immobilis]VTR99731.1 unnamed protein product [Tuwongella immobilis]
MIGFGMLWILGTFIAAPQEWIQRWQSASDSARPPANARAELQALAHELAEAWDAGPRLPVIADLQARIAWQLDQLPQAIAAVRAGLAEFPHDRTLAETLHALRQSRAIPEDPQLRAALQMPELDSWHGWLPIEWQAGTFVALIWLAVFCCIRGWSRQRGGWFIAAGVLCVLAGVGEWRRQADCVVRERFWRQPAAVIQRDGVLLREGNAAAYPALFRQPLPNGCEMQLLGERGGWCWVELPDGGRGWVPRESLQMIATRRES